MKRKIVYLMHIDWGVIKQRPHFIAENLSNSFDVTVCSMMTYRKGRMVQNVTNAGIVLARLLVLPFGRFQLVSKINTMLVKLQLRKIVAKADFVWITHPLMFEAVRAVLPVDTKLIYDCMDDAMEFPLVCRNATYKAQIFELEESLVNRCNIVFSSSSYLSCKLTHRYGHQINSLVINNAISIPEFDQDEDSPDLILLDELIDSIYGTKLLYLGAISEWMDFDLILRSVDRIPDITYIFVGPCDLPVPHHPRIIIFGPIEHRNIFRAMNRADALIMPFKVNELIRSVDPVKIYDYIHSCKPVIVVGYGETEKFEDFIHLYRDQEEYIEILKMLVAGNLFAKKEPNECLNFSMGNTWSVRVRQMLPILEVLD